MEPKVTVRHIKMLIFAWLHGEIAELQQKTGYSQLEKSLQDFNVPSSNMRLHTSRR